MKKPRTLEQKIKRRAREASRREELRKHRMVGLNKEFKKPETSGISFAESEWNKQLFNLSTIISRACLAFFKRRGIIYEYKRDEWSKAN